MSGYLKERGERHFNDLVVDVLVNGVKGICLGVGLGVWVKKGKLWGGVGGGGAVGWTLEKHLNYDY